MHDIDVIRLKWRAVQNCSETSDEKKFNISMVKGGKYRAKITFDHSALVSPGFD